MMYVFLLACLSVCLAGPLDDLAWQDYKLEFGKVYSEEEDAIRYRTWRQNMMEIEFHNAEYSNTYKQGQNEFTDMTDEEFERDYNGCVFISEDDSNETLADAEVFVAPNVQLPTEVNWVSKGYVTEVKNQGRCGSCYSFGATGGLEGQWFKKHNKLISLSEQQIVDCSSKNQGCNGGWYMYAWQYVRDIGGIQTEESYPYEEKQSKCRVNKEYFTATCRGYVMTKRGSEEELTKAIATVGPIAVAFDSNHPEFKRYKKGVYYNKNCSTRKLTHAVLAVGYGTEDGQDYYLVKNSWGPRFGLGGYFKMARNRDNNCGIASRPSYPLV